MGAQITQGLGNAWSVLVSFVPKLLGFLLILLVGWLIAKAVSKAVDFLLGKVGFDKLVEKSGIAGAMGNSPITPRGLLVKLVYYFILLIALNYAFRAFGSGNPVSSMLNQIIAYLPRVLVAVLLVLIAAAIGRVVRDLVTGALGQRPFTKILGTIVFVFIIGLGVIAALSQMGIAMSVTLPVLVTVLGTIGGILVVGVGGGLIRPMQARWEGWLNSMQREAAASDGRKPQARPQNSERVGSTAGTVSGVQPTHQMPRPSSEPPTPPSGFQGPDAP
ncbi:MAG: mechanosensitive ion channel family protein [Sciscionella sp.]